MWYQGLQQGWLCTRHGFLFLLRTKGRRGLEGRGIGWSSSRVAMKTPGAKSSWDADENEDVREKEVPKDTFRYTWFLSP